MIYLLYNETAKHLRILSDVQDLEVLNPEFSVHGNRMLVQDDKENRILDAPYDEVTIFYSR